MQIPDFVSSKDKDLQEGYYAVVDWIANNPMNVSMRYPVLVAINLTEKDVRDLLDNKLNLPVTIGAIQRAILKITTVKDLREKPTLLNEKIEKKEDK